MTNAKTNPAPDPDALDADTLTSFRGRLRQERADLLARNESRLTGVLDADDAVTDEAEHAVADNERAMSLRLADKDRKLLSLIDHALGKFETGEFGLCEGTGELIERARLELRPWARYSVEYKMVLERERALHAGG
ncbi:MAG: TraR/DksA C4-type zinc finger protein [Nannocystaceae bacterium]